jgi:hypothetical protein
MISPSFAPFKMGYSPILSPPPTVQVTSVVSGRKLAPPLLMIGALI